jgi:tetratricopeptide (TPR) repeat protein
MFRKSWFVVALLGALAAGCTETEVRQSEQPAWLQARPKSHRFDDLKAAVEKDPKDAKAWFEFGAYWEESLDFQKAAECYERGSELIDPTRWTRPNYTLGRVYFRMQDFDRSIRHLEAVIQYESPDPAVSCLNPDFRESHYLRGAIYYLHNRWREARRDFLRFVELGGEDARVEQFLDKIDHEIR